MANISKKVPSSGERLLPQTLDGFAAHTPQRLYASVPRGRDLSQGFQDVTFAEVATCANHMAHWITSHFGRSENLETLAFVGISDLRSAAIFLGAVKAGYKVLFPSPRNTPEVNLSLMNQTSCLKLLFVSEMAPVVKFICANDGGEGLITEQVPSFQEMLSSKPEPYPFNRTFEKAKYDPIVVLHSSGSTGRPKPIVMTNGTFAVVDNERNLPKVPGRRNRDTSVYDFEGGGRVYTVYPYFHMAGFYMLVVNPIFTEASIPVLGPPLEPPSGSLLKEIMLQQKLSALFLPPSISEQLLNEPNGIDFFKGLKFVGYTGGPFSPAAGDAISKVTDLCSLYGQTETWQVPQLYPAREDWAWMEWNPHYKLNMEPSDDEPGTFELVIFADESTERTSGVNHNMPGTSVYRTKDLFVRHPDPEKPHLYKYHGRRDDIIVLSNGEKFNPVPLELSVQVHKSLKGALVIGAGRSEASLLIEPKVDIPQDDLQKLIDNVWPLVEESNALLPAQGRIMRHLVSVAKPEKPFMRAGKGTVIRKLTEAEYQSEIDALYSQSSSAAVRELPLLQSTTKVVYDITTIRRFVQDIIGTIFPKFKGIRDDDDMFSLGFDSIMIPVFISNLKNALLAGIPNASFAWLNSRVVFQNPTVSALSSMIFHSLDTDDSSAHEKDDTSRTSKMQKIIRKYSQGLPSKLPSLSKGTNPQNIALLGSTGYLGPWILKSLLENTDVANIYCLNRGDPEEAKSRTTKALQELGTYLNGAFQNTRFISITLGSPRLGLDEAQFSSLTSEVDTILYNSWRPDYSIPVQSFEKPFLDGLRQVIDWSITSTRAPHIVFVSSASAVGRWRRVDPAEFLIPEVSIPENMTDVALEMGYGESKCIAECILAKANGISRIPVSILRIGQIGGPSRVVGGHWPAQEWLRAVIKTSKELGVVPTGISAVDWIPVDALASIVSSVAATQGDIGNEGLAIMNLLHPKTESWSSFLDILSTRFGITGPRIPLPEWMDRLDDAVKTSMNVEVEVYPALKFYDFFRSIGDGLEHDMRCRTENMEKVFKGSIEPLDKDLIGEWLQTWEF